jgi:predicted amidohydrolase YtcJ
VAVAERAVFGRIATLAGDRGFGWVDAIAISDGRVVAAGSRADIEPLVGTQTTRIELGPSEVAVPGLSDAHLHLVECGLGVDRVDLEGATTAASALDAIRRSAAGLSPDAWLQGHGWDVERLGGWPTADMLESVAPGRRAAIWAHDHHAIWVSHAALAEAGIDDGTPDPRGGLIRRDAGGSATGVLHETASRVVTGAIPAPTPEAIERGVVDEARRLIALGVVAVHDPGPLSPQSGLGPAFAAYQSVTESGRLPIRVHVSIRSEQLDAAIAAQLRSGMPIGSPAGRGGGARFGWLKLFADGTLASRTAALLEPIEREPDNPVPLGLERGMFATTPDELAALALRAAAAGIATQIHAIGDHAVRVALDVLAPATRSVELMPRVEHVQLIDEADVSRFARDGIAASVQPVHLRTDAQVARRLWGARAERSGYAWRSLLEAGAVVAFGTDAPIEPTDPWPGLAMAVTRSHPSWSDGPTDPATFGPRERLTLDEAMRAACVAPAIAAAEHDRGRLVAGHRADVVVVDDAAFDEPVEPDGALANARPRLVMIDGEIVFEA